MTQRDPERFMDANNMFTLSVLSNDGFEEKEQLDTKLL